MKILFLLTLIVFPVSVLGQPSKESQRLVEIFGWNDLYRDAAAPPVWAKLPEEERKGFEEKTGYPLEKLVMDLALWIDREFSDDEKAEILRFLKSDTGQKFSKVFFEDNDGTGEIHKVVGDWIAGRYQEMEAHLNGR